MLPKNMAQAFDLLQIEQNHNKIIDLAKYIFTRTVMEIMDRNDPDLIDLQNDAREKIRKGELKEKDAHLEVALNLFVKLSLVRQERMLSLFRKQNIYISFHLLSICQSTQLFLVKHKRDKEAFFFSKLNILIANQLAKETVLNRSEKENIKFSTPDKMFAITDKLIEFRSLSKIIEISRFEQSTEALLVGLTQGMAALYNRLIEIDKKIHKKSTVVDSPLKIEKAIIEDSLEAFNLQKVSLAEMRRCADYSISKLISHTTQIQKIAIEKLRNPMVEQLNDESLFSKFVDKFMDGVKKVFSWGQSLFNTKFHMSKSHFSNDFMEKTKEFIHNSLKAK